MEPRTARFGLGLAVVGALLGAFLPSPPPVPPAGAAGSDGWKVSYSRTDVALHTGAPIQADRNLVWCATVQMAWDALVDAMGVEGRLELAGPTAAATAAAALHRSRFPPDAIDAASSVALSGLVRDGILTRIDVAWRERFPNAGASPPIYAGPEDVVAFAALRKSLPFATPFRVHAGRLPFGDTGERVRMFGMEKDDRGPDVEEMAKQVVVYGGVASDGATVVELIPEGGADRIVLSTVRPGGTLESAWQGAAERMRRAPREVLDRAVELLVPRIRMDLERHFPEVEGATIAERPGARIAEVRQRIEFALSEHGAILESFAVAVGSLGISEPLRFDRPFLLALQRAGAGRPYFLLWVGNADLLDRSAPEPAPAEVLQSFTGAWTIDAPRSTAYNATLHAERDDAARGRRLKDSLQRLFQGLEIEMEFSPSGEAVCRQRSRSVSGGDARPWRITKGRVMALEGRAVFVPVVLPGDRDGEEEDLGSRDPYAPWPLEVAGRLIRVRVPDIWVVCGRQPSGR